MSLLKDIADLILQTFFNLYILAVLLRFLLQLSRADFYNPISQFLVKATSPLLNPLRRIIPGIGGIDVAAVILALILQIIATTVLILIQGYGFQNPIALLIWASLGTLGIIVNIYFVAILASIILSWVAPGSYNPAVILLRQLTEPIMAPFRNIIPPMGGLDLSPIFVFLTINILQMVLNYMAAGVGLPKAYVIGI